MMNFRRMRRGVPELNTASLPDLIFSVLFFFIIVTHMRQETVRVKYRVPDGKELTKIVKKSTVTHIYIGKPVETATSANGEADYRVQLNDNYVTVNQLVDQLADIKKKMSPEDAQLMTVAISADKDVDMQTVMTVKQALRRANVPRVTFVGTETKKETAKKNNAAKGERNEKKQ